MAPLISIDRNTANRHDDLDNYDVGDLSDDPFASPSPTSSAKKHKDAPTSGLGIDEEVAVQKRARPPNVKLDEERLLGPAGIPKLRQRARELKIKGKGHEFSDAARLLSFYQMWLDDLFPKAKFLDALAMVEKAGHKKRVVTARNELINEAKPKTTVEDDEGFGLDDTGAAATEEEAQNAGAGAAITSPSRLQTPDDVPNDEDLYDATPRVNRTSTTARPNDDVPQDEDDLDALIAEAEGQDNNSHKPPSPGLMAQGPAEDEDDLDALIAEAESRDQGKKSQSLIEPSSGTKSHQDFADDEAAMQEMDMF